MADYDYDMFPEADDEEDYYPDFYPDNDALSEEDKSPWDNQDHFPVLTLEQLFYRCIVPTIKDGSHHVSVALAWCVVYRISTQISKIYG